MKSEKKLEELWNSFYRQVGENLSESTAYDWVDRTWIIVKRLENEIDILRLYGNKDCTAMADVHIDEMNAKTDDQMLKEEQEQAIKDLNR